MTPVFWAKQDSTAATVAKAAQLPQLLWFLTGETMPKSLQSQDLGAAALDRGGKEEEVVFCFWFSGTPATRFLTDQPTV